MTSMIPLDATTFKKHTPEDSMSKKERSSSHIDDSHAAARNNDLVVDSASKSQKRLLKHDDAGALDPLRKKSVSSCGSGFDQEEVEASDAQTVSEEYQAVQDVENVVVDSETLQSQWDDVCEKIMNDPESTPYRESLETFLFGMKQVEAAQKSLQETYDTVLTSLDKNLESVLASAVPIHEMDCSLISHTEMEISELFRNNHHVRKTLLQSLNNHNHAWEVKYRDYTSRLVVSKESTTPTSEDICDNSISKLSTSTTRKDDHALQHVDYTVAESNGLNWDELVQLCPMLRGKIEVFLNGCDRWSTACNELSSSFDEIRQTIQNHHANILHIVEAAYSRINDSTMDVQDKVQGYIVTNLSRRSHLEQSLEEIVQRQNSIFSRLMARVVGNVSNSWKRSASEQSNNQSF